MKKIRSIYANKERSPKYVSFLKSAERTYRMIQFMLLKKDTYTQI